MLTTVMVKFCGVLLGTGSSLSVTSSVTLCSPTSPLLGRPATDVSVAPAIPMPIPGVKTNQVGTVGALIVIVSSGMSGSVAEML